MKCGKCGADNLDQAKFCKQCGESLAAIDGPVCPSCASPCKPGTKFCPRCGGSMTDTPAKAAAVVDVAPRAPLPLPVETPPLEPVAVKEPVNVPVPKPAAPESPAISSAAPVSTRSATKNLDLPLDILPEARHASSKGPVALVGAIVALLLAAGAAWYWLSAPGNSEPPAVAPPPVAIAPTPEAPPVPVTEPAVEQPKAPVETVAPPAPVENPPVAAKTPEPPVEAAPAAPTKRKPAREPAAPRPSKPDASAKPLPAANHTPPVAETAPPPPPTIDQTYQERTARECSPGFTGTFCRESVKISLCSKRWSPDPPAGQRICAQTVRAPGD